MSYYEVIIRFLTQIRIFWHVKCSGLSSHWRIWVSFPDNTQSNTFEIWPLTVTGPPNPEKSFKMSENSPVSRKLPVFTYHKVPLSYARRDAYTESQCRVECSDQAVIGVNLHNRHFLVTRYSCRAIILHLCKSNYHYAIALNRKSFRRVVKIWWA